ncbi:MAG: LLM class flavin-dependent oxidoreductase [Alphaproteobacteria bacterium]|nr:LLM class flavin-dependent oxidoreductase [Alphaproteobacteria bacterium]
MDLPLDTKLTIGFSATMATPQAARDVSALADRLGYDSLWTGDHIAFAVPMLDPLLQLAQVAAINSRLLLGTGVYLMPLRHATTVAKLVATFDHLSEGRFIFGVGVGGEFPNEYSACGVPVKERGARLTEGIQTIRKLWTGHPVSNEDSKFYPFTDVQMLPRPVTPGGPPIWTGGRSKAALTRCGRLADGWMSYVVTPEMYRDGLQQISVAAKESKRDLKKFGSSHLVFMRIDDTYERALDLAAAHLTRRYAMDFRPAAKKYAVLGTPSDCAKRIADFHAAGVRHFVLDCTGPLEERDAQLERFSKEVRPLLGQLAAA